MDSNMSPPLTCDNTQQMKTINEKQTNTTLSKEKEMIIEIQETRDIHASLKPTSYIETFAHTIKGTIGCGMLALGSAFQHGGLAFTSLLLVFIGFITTYNQHLLVNMADDFKEEKKVTSMGYCQTIEIAFEKGPRIARKLSKFTGWATIVFIVFTQLGFCCVYLMFVSKSANQVLAHYDLDIPESTCLLVALPVFIFTSLIRELKYIAPLSSIANISIFASLGLMLFYNTQELPPITERRMIGDLQGIAICFGTATFSMEGINLVLPLQQNMKDKHRFLGAFGVLNVAMGAVVVFMIIFGFFGYYKHGENVQDSLTMNLNPDNVLTQVVVVGMMVGILFSYALQFFVPILMILPTLRKITINWPGGHSHLYEYFLRAFLVCVTYLVVRKVPHFELLISLVGAVGGSFLALIFAPLADIAYQSSFNKKISFSRMFLNIISLFIGIGGFTIGSSSSISAIIDAVSNESIAANAL